MYISKRCGDVYSIFFNLFCTVSLITFLWHVFIFMSSSFAMYVYSHIKCMCFNALRLPDANNSRCVLMSFRSFSFFLFHAFFFALFHIHTMSIEFQIERRKWQFQFARAFHAKNVNLPQCWSYQLRWMEISFFFSLSFAVNFVYLFRFVIL